MSTPRKFDLDKIKQLIATASSPKQKAMYQALLQKAQQSSSPSPANTEDQPPLKPLIRPQRPPLKSTEKDTPTSHHLSQPKNPPTNPPAQIQSQDQSSQDQSKPDFLTSASFRAVGLIKAQVHVDDLENLSVTFQGHTYPLPFARGRRSAHYGLKSEIKHTGISTYRLVVYPKVIHFPQKDLPHQVFFQLLAFDKGAQHNSLFDQINEFEFKLSGLWQFIAPCRLPCISVFRNFTPELLDYMNSDDIIGKVKTFKGSHLPVIWKDAPVRPFRFNPKLSKEEQGHPYFVQIKARFLPERNLFTFVQQLTEPSDIAPKFLKASQQDKMEAAKKLKQTASAQKKTHQKKTQKKTPDK